MMMTQQFPAHQGIPQHAGLPPGHPMAQAQHPNIGVQGPGTGMVQQLHPGVSSATGPQATQPGPMVAMPPGATTGPGGPMPNAAAHALSHLNPTQAHLLQQQQFANFANNPQMLHQQQVLRQRQLILQQQQAQQAQQAAQHPGIPGSLPAGSQGLNAAQIAAMQNPGMRPMNMLQLHQQMPHMQPASIQQQQQFLAMQQAQQQAAQQASNAAQQGQQTPQQRTTMPPSTATSAPATAPTSGTPSQQPPNAPPHSAPQQQPQQGAQGGPQPTTNPPHQPASQAQQSQPQMPTSQPPSSQAQTQPPASQPQATGLTQPQLQHLHHQQQFLFAQQQQAMARQSASRALLNHFFETLANSPSDADLPYWQQFVDRFYNTHGMMPGVGVLRQAVLTSTSGTKSFEVATSILPRYYYTLYNNGIKKIQTFIDNQGIRESLLPNGNRVLDCPRATTIYWFTNECQLFVTGGVRAIINNELRFDVIDLSVSSFREYVPRSLLLPSEATDPKQSPRLSKTANKRAQQKMPTTAGAGIPESLINENGIPPGVQGFLEIAETLSQMSMVFSYALANQELSPMDALNKVTVQMAAASAGMNSAMQQIPAQRAANVNGPTQFASPSTVNMALPGVQGSPHPANSAHPSPAPSQLAGPGMMIPGNQAALGSNGNQVPSGNASPNVPQKRRRASTVKAEGDEGSGGVEANGTAGPAGAAKVKASPRVGGKRQKGTAS